MPARLNSTQYETLLDFVGSLHACRSLTDFPALLVNGFHALIPCNWVSYNEVYPARERTIAMLEPETPGILLRLKDFREHLHEHPVINYTRATGDGTALQIDDFLTREEFHALDLYQKFYRQIGVEHQIAFSILPEGSEIILGVAFSRGTHKYTEEERLILNLARPHVAQAYLNLVELGHLRSQLDRLSSTLDALDHGVLHFSHQGVLLYASAPARELLERHFHWTGGARLPSALEDWARAATSSLDETPETFTHNDLTARLSQRTEFHYVTILLESIATPHPPDPELLQQALGLTPREAEVLAWIAAGKPNSDIAAILGTSLYTIKAHVRAILEKLGVENRTSAAARALEAGRR